MKAWELIKHLEEGGKIRRPGATVSYNLYEYKEALSLEWIINQPQTWEIVKPKKKIKLYRYTYSYSDEVTDYYTEQSHWITWTWDEMPLSKDEHQLLKIEEKEVEI